MIDPVELKPGSKAAQVKTIRLPATGRKQIVFRLTDENGKAVTLVAEPTNEDAPTAKFDYQHELSEGTAKVRLRAKESFSSSKVLFDVEGTILEVAKPECKGMIEFILTNDMTCHPGVYVCEVGRFSNPDYLVDTWPCYLALEPTVFSEMRGSGTLTIAEVRLGLDDLLPTEVSLLDGVEFSDEQIMHAIRQVVDLWNETPPPVARHTVKSFPYRYRWIQGTIAQLYRMRAHSYRRNQLNYSAGGMTIDDQNKSQEYQAISDSLMEEFRQWMLAEKIKINIDKAWGIGL
jgi:hypothetical protein